MARIRGRVRAFSALGRFRAMKPTPPRRSKRTSSVSLIVSRLLLNKGCDSMQNTAVVPGLVPGTHWSQHVAVPYQICTPSRRRLRSEEHTSELQSLMRISYAVFCLKKKKNHINKHNETHHTTMTTR